MWNVLFKHCVDWAANWRVIQILQQPVNLDRLIVILDLKHSSTICLIVQTLKPHSIVLHVALVDLVLKIDWRSLVKVKRNYSQTFKPTSASNSGPSHSTNRKSFFYLFEVLEGGFVQSFTQPHESVTRLPQRATRHIKGTCPLVDSDATMGKCKVPGWGIIWT